MELVLLAELLNAQLVEYFQEFYSTPFIGHCLQQDNLILWTLPMWRVVIHLAEVEKCYVNIIKGNFRVL
jgi:hypothetical protein